MKRRKEVIEDLAERLLDELGVDFEEGDIKHTPERVARALLELTRSYSKEPPTIKTFPAPKDEQVIVIGDLHFFSLCEHHELPFEGKVTLVYIPDEKIVGLSKPARCVDYFSHKLMIQERFEQELLDYLWEAIEPKAMMIKIEARHLCSSMRGIQSREHYIKNFTLKFKDNIDEKQAESRMWKALRR